MFGECDSDDEEGNATSGNADSGLSKTQVKSLKSQLKTIVIASKDVLHKLNEGYYDRCPDPNKVCDFGGGKRLTEREIEFYKENKSVSNILQRLKSKIDAASDYQLFLVDKPSSDQLAGMMCCLLLSYDFHTNTL